MLANSQGEENSPVRKLDQVPDSRGKQGRRGEQPARQAPKRERMEESAGRSYHSHSAPGAVVLFHTSPLPPSAGSLSFTAEMFRDLHLWGHSTQNLLETWLHFSSPHPEFPLAGHHHPPLCTKAFPNLSTNLAEVQAIALYLFIF